VAVELADRVDRLVLMDTGVFTGEQPMTDDWLRFRAFVERVDELPVGLLVRRGCHADPGDEVAAAYDAPFPSEASKAGARAFPAILPTERDAPGAEAGRRTLAALQADERPMLLLWGEEDPVLPPAAGEALASALGQPAPRRIAGAGHFLQEDRGEEVGALIADWLR
jgi:haloalkane dehalogenase